MKRGPQNRKEKALSITKLLACIRSFFKKITPEKENGSRGKPQEIPLVDVLMSAVAMFSLKFPSLLKFDEAYGKDKIRHNLKTLYGVQNAPCDTHMRFVLDSVLIESIRGVYSTIFERVQRAKLLQNYSFLDGYILAIDGTEYFESNKVRCENCCVKNHRDGSVGYYHQMLSGVIIKPGIRQVLSLCPEPITKQDGCNKNDCELAAVRRFLSGVKKDHPKLPLIIAADALHANTPNINFIKGLGYHFIMAAKPGCHHALFDWISGLSLSKTTKIVGKNQYILRYINDVPLNDNPDAPTVNFLDCRVVEIDGNRKFEKHFTYVTDYKINNKNAYELMCGGRAKWKIENETFNTLKNQGYQFEHNFGHGKKHLSSVLALLMMLAFLLDQIQEASDLLFQKALVSSGARMTLWESLRSTFRIFYLDSWEVLHALVADDGSVSAHVVFNSNSS